MRALLKGDIAGERTRSALERERGKVLALTMSEEVPVIATSSVLASGPRARGPGGGEYMKGYTSILGRADRRAGMIAMELPCKWTAWKPACARGRTRCDQTAENTRHALKLRQWTQAEVFRRAVQRRDGDDDPWATRSSRPRTVGIVSLTGRA